MQRRPTPQVQASFPPPVHRPGKGVSGTRDVPTDGGGRKRGRRGVVGTGRGRETRVLYRPPSPLPCDFPSGSILFEERWGRVVQTRKVRGGYSESKELTFYSPYLSFSEMGTHSDTRTETCQSI